MIIAESGPTYPDAGVIAASPATPPVTIPRALGFPPCFQLTAIHVRAPAAAEVFVTMKAFAARHQAESALPALNPNHPTHRRIPPSIALGTLCGAMLSLLKPMRLPMIIAAASAENPALMCTTRPPAKSRAPSSRSQPPVPQTQCAIGSYTMVVQMRVKTMNVLNFILSAKAPVIRTGVMIANIAWYIMNTDAGIVGA